MLTYIYSPVERRRKNCALFYCMDWFGKIWVNNELVVPKIGGPHKSYARVPITLKRGWNTVLVKTATGKGGWHAGLAVTDDEALRIRSRPE